ncbi:Hypothetical predicted protein [Paramuricea clavata]|uniref:Uncharacterized protein n=1 Tax=Paramuricea clavata TaxID=317549 RepID=A0A6S7HRK0_PARCT|nr:Hypothetical predicted protein [Paramuricea clavata]
MKQSDEYQMHVILGDSTYCRIKTEVFKGEPGDPIVEGITFRWTIHGGEFSSDGCWFSREVQDSQQLYSLDVLGVEVQGENDQLDVHREFKENIVHDINRRYKRVERKLQQDECLRKDYEKIIIDQVAAGIIEKAPDTPTGERVFYMPHKPVLKQDAITTKTPWMVFNASTKPQPISSIVNECMYPGPPFQPLLWDILVCARMLPYLLIGDIEKRETVGNG